MGDSGIIGSASAFRDGHRQIENRCNPHGTFSDRTFRFDISFVELTSASKVHSHGCSELAIVLGGRGVHVTEHGALPMEHGEVVVTAGSCRHGWRDPEQLKLCVIVYDPRQFLTEVTDLRSLAGFRSLFNGVASSPSLHLPAEDLVYVTSLLSAMQTEFAARIPGRQTIIRSTFLLLVTYLSRVYARQTKTTTHSTGRMANVIAHIREHFREPLAIEELARLVHLSPSQFHRNFKRAYNTTPV